MKAKNEMIRKFNSSVSGWWGKDEIWEVNGKRAKLIGFIVNTIGKISRRTNPWGEGAIKVKGKLVFQFKNGKIKRYNANFYFIWDSGRWELDGWEPKANLKLRFVE